MNIDDAAELVNGLVFRPGWEISAEEMSGVLLVFFDIDTFDTSYPGPTGVYYKAKKIMSSKYIRNVEDLTPDQVRYRILELAHEVDWHEDCEFLREKVDGQWVAPFHPHNPDTDERRIAAAISLGRTP